MHEIQTTVNLKFVNMPWRLGKKPLDHFLPGRRRDSPRRQYREAASVTEHLRGLVQRGPLKNVVNVRYHEVPKEAHAWKIGSHLVSRDALQGLLSVQLIRARLGTDFDNIINDTDERWANYPSHLPTILKLHEPWSERSDVSAVLRLTCVL